MWENFDKELHGMVVDEVEERLVVRSIEQIADQTNDSIKGNYTTSLESWNKQRAKDHLGKLTKKTIA